LTGDLSEEKEEDLDDHNATPINREEETGHLLV
jgi:hypothetical protein